MDLSSLWISRDLASLFLAVFKRLAFVRMHDLSASATGIPRHYDGNGMLHPTHPLTAIGLRRAQAAHLCARAERGVPTRWMFDFFVNTGMPSAA
jgi:hypothetical protein